MTDESDIAILQNDVEWLRNLTRGNRRRIKDLEADLEAYKAEFGSLGLATAIGKYPLN